MYRHVKISARNWAGLGILSDRLSFSSINKNTRLGGVKKAWSCQPCSSNALSTPRSHKITSDARKRVRFLQWQRTKFPRQRRASLLIRNDCEIGSLGFAGGISTPWLTTCMESVVLIGRLISWVCARSGGAGSLFCVSVSLNLLDLEGAGSIFDFIFFLPTLAHLWRYAATASQVVWGALFSLLWMSLLTW